MTITGGNKVSCFSAKEIKLNRLSTMLKISEKDHEGSSKASKPKVNLSLVRQTVLNQAIIGSTIWTGGYGAQVLAKYADISLVAVISGIVGVIPLILFSRWIEQNEAPEFADLNVSTNMLVLRLFGNRSQPAVAFVVSALLAGLTGLVEETTFRGGILYQLAERFDSLPLGFALSTVLFAVLHVNPLGFFQGLQGAKDAAYLVGYQLVTGSIFGALFVLSGNLVVPIVAHGIFDFYVFFATHLTVTSQMKYARDQAVMPVAPDAIQNKWIAERGRTFVQGACESFYLADTNRDGVLSRQELRISLYSYGIRLTTEQSEEVAKAADEDGNGAIDFGEFLEFVGPSGSPEKAIKKSLLGID